MRNKTRFGIAIVLLFLLTINVSALRIIPNSVGTFRGNNNIKVYWITDTKADTKVNYGIDSIDKEMSGGVNAIDHAVYISNPEANKEYSYTVTSCIEDNCVSSDILHFIYNIPDKTPPVLTLNEIPKEVYDANFNIDGTVNEESNITVILDAQTVLTQENVNQSFTIGLTLHDGNNNIEIDAIDKAGNKAKVSFNIKGDVTPIQIIDSNLDEIDKDSNKKQTITGTINKPFTEIEIQIGNDTYKTTSDKNGKFSIDITLNINAGEVANDILISALRGDGKLVDLYGSAVNFFQCQAKGEGIWWKVNVTDLTPDVIIPEHLLNGIAQFGFRLDFEYIGSGQNPQIISDPFVVPAPLNQLQQDKMQEELIGTPVVQCTDDKRHCYVLVNLLPWQGSKEELYDKTEWFKVFGTKIMELTLPLELKIPFTQDVNGKPEQKDQDMCWFFNLMIDVPIKLRPTALLKGSIKSLNTTITAIDTIKKPIEDWINPGLFLTCTGMGAYELFPALGYNTKCNPVVSGVTSVSLAKKLAANGEKTCPSSTTAFGEPDTGCQNCLDAIWNYRHTKIAKQWVCDRIFCPAVPTLEKHAKEYTDPLTGHKSVCLSSITPSLTTSGIPSENPDKAPTITINPTSVSSSDACKKEYLREWDTAGLFLNEYGRATGNNDDFQNTMDELMQKSQAMCPAVEAFPSQVVKVGDKEYYIDEDKTVSIVDCYIPATNQKDVVHITPEQTCTILQKNIPDALIPPEIEKKLNYEDLSKKDYIFDPTSGPFEALEGGCTPAISGYLNQWQSILGATQKCLQTVLMTGEGSSGMCKAVLSQYVCDAIWDSIRCLGGGLTTMSQERLKDNEDHRRKTNFFTSASAAVGSVTSSIKDRYGQTSMFNTMFNEKKLVHSACLGFFGIDMPDGLDLRSMLSSQVAMPVLNSEAMLIPTTRRFITSNPINHGWATHIYHLGYAIQAGADISYTLKLVCSNDLSCNDQDYVNPKNVPMACDGYSLGQPIERVIDQGNVKAGDLLNQEKYQKIEDKVRYDKAILQWSWTNNHGEQQTGQIVKHINLVGMTPPDYCSFNTDYNEYRCHAIVSDGKVYFTGTPFPQYPSGSQAFSLGDPIRLTGSLVSEMDAKNPAPKYLNMTILNSNGLVVASGQSMISQPGVVKLEEMPFWPTLTQDMFKKADGSPNCPETASFTVILEVLNSKKSDQGNYYPTNELSQVDGAIQQKQIKINVKCSTQSGNPPVKINNAKLIWYDDNGQSHSSDLTSIPDNQEIYLASDKTLTFTLQTESQNEVTIGLSVDGSDFQYQSSQPSGKVDYIWTPQMETNYQTFKVQFRIKDGQSESVFPAQPKTIQIVNPDLSSSVTI